MCMLCFGLCILDDNAYLASLPAAEIEPQAKPSRLDQKQTRSDPLITVSLVQLQLENPSKVSK